MRPCGLSNTRSEPASVASPGISGTSSVPGTKPGAGVSASTAVERPSRAAARIRARVIGPDDTPLSLAFGTIECRAVGLHDAQDALAAGAGGAGLALLAVDPPLMLEKTQFPA